MSIPLRLNSEEFRHVRNRHGEDVARPRETVGQGKANSGAVAASGRM